MRDGRVQDPRSLSVSVVIAAYTEDRWNDVLRAVDSSRAQTAAPLETLVVIDHNSTLFARASRHYASLPDVRVVESTGERGLAGARNTGAAAAQGDVVAFLDDDAVAEPEWLERLSMHYANSLVLGVGGKIEPHWLAGRPGSFPPEFDWVVGCSYRGLPQTAEPVRNIIGANMSFRRDVLEGVGGFRVGIGRVGQRPLGCEETELCLRAQRRWPDGLIIYEPSARVRHTVPAERGSWGYFLRRCYGEGLSKALLSRLAGPADGLRSERTYVLHTVRRGVAANVVGAIVATDAASLARAARMVVGVAATTAGFAAGAFGLASGASRDAGQGAHELEASDRHSDPALDVSRPFS